MIGTVIVVCIWKSFRDINLKFRFNLQWAEYSTLSRLGLTVLLQMFSLYDAFFLEMRKLQVKPIRVWLEVIEQKRQNIFLFLSQSFLSEFKHKVESIKGKVINVTVSQKMPYINMHGHMYEGHNHEICGYVGDLWHELEDVLQFKTKFTVKSEILDERAALRESSDNLILNPTVLKSGDRDEFQSTMPVANTWFRLSLLNTKSGNSFFYMSIFTTSLLATYLVTMMILTFTLWFIIQAYYGRKFQVIKKDRHFIRNSNAPVEADCSFMASFLTILGTLTNQGAQLKPTTVSLRLILLSSTLFGFVLIQSYSAILLSQLAVNQIPSPIKFQELPFAMPYDRSFCISERSFAYHAFLINGTSEIKPEWKPFLNKPPCTSGSSDIVPLQDYCNENNMVFESQHSTYYIRNVANYNTSYTADCDFYTFPTRYYSSYIALLTKKDFEYTTLISNYLLKFHTTGIVKRLQDIWLPLTAPAVVKVKSIEAIKFAHMKDLLHLYFMAILFSLIILLCEMLVHYKYNSSGRMVKKWAIKKMQKEAP